MHDYDGSARSSDAVPGDPVEILGFDGVPDAGESFRVVENDRKAARTLAGERANRLKTEMLARRSGRKVSFEDVFKRAQEGEIKELQLVLKADVSGSLEAFEDEIAKLPQQEVQVNIIHTGVGGITESDVMLAAASDAVILGFNVRPVGDARAAAEREGVEIRTYSIIYKALDDLRAAMEGLLEPEEVEETVGSVEVRQIFRASRAGHHRRLATSPTASCAAAPRSASCATAPSSTTRRSAACAASTTTRARSRPGFECGIVLDNFQDVKEGDVLEVYETQQGRARARGLGPVSDCRDSYAVAAARAPALPGRAEPEGQAQGAGSRSRRSCAAASARAVAEVDHQDALAARRRWPRRSSAARWAGSTTRVDGVERWLEARFPQGVRIERTLASPASDLVGIAMSTACAASNEAIARSAQSTRSRQDLKDPRVGFVTVTAVETTPDLRHARVFVSVLGDDGRARARRWTACSPRTATCSARSPRAAPQAHAAAEFNERRHRARAPTRIERLLARGRRSAMSDRERGRRARRGARGAARRRALPARHPRAPRRRRARLAASRCTAC